MGCMHKGVGLRWFLPCSWSLRAVVAWCVAWIRYRRSDQYIYTPNCTRFTIKLVYRTPYQLIWLEVLENHTMPLMVYYCIYILNRGSMYRALDLHGVHASVHSSCGLKEPIQIKWSRNLKSTELQILRDLEVQTLRYRYHTYSKATTYVQAS